MEDLQPSIDTLRDEYTETQLNIRSLDMEIFNLQQQRHAKLAQCAGLLVAINLIERGYQ